MNPNVPWYLNPLFVTPFIGLIGVIVGGTITAASTFLVEWRREKIRQERDDREYGAQFTAAAKLVHSELLHGFAAAKVCVRAKRWLPTTYPVLSLDNWTAFQRTISHLPYNSWISIVIAVIGIQSLNIQRESLISPAPDLSPKQLKELEEIFEALKDGVEALDSYAGRKISSPATTTRVSQIA